MNELKLSVVIPAHNEEQYVGRVLSELQQALRHERIPYEIIVVNDNSVDKTPEVIASFMESDRCIRRVDREAPSGFGRAIRSGLDVVQGDVVIIYMADCSDFPDDAVAYYRKIEEGYDCVFGSRFIRGSKVTYYPIVKLVINRIVNKLIQVMFWTRHNDTTNAFKAYRTKVIKECGPYRASHFNITVEMSLSALIRKYHVATIPIQWNGRSWHSSHLRLRAMGRRYLSTLLKIFFESILIGDDIMADLLAERRSLERKSSQFENRLEQIERRLLDLETKASSPDPESLH